MYFSIHKMSDYAESLLKYAKGPGAVHSVYRRTVNLCINGRLLALQSSCTPLSPLSLITELSAADMEALTIEKGDKVRITEDAVEICAASGSFLFTYSNALCYDLKLPSVFAGISDADSLSLKERLIKNIEEALSHAGTGGFASIFNGCPEEELSLMLLAAKKHIEDSALLYRGKEFEKAGSVLSRLLGLGIGLTPSGDDFLCGVLAGLCLSGKGNTCFEKKLRLEIETHLTDTIDISAAFLFCALEGQYSLAVNSLAQIPGPAEIADVFSEIGHSSGMDTLCGVFYVLKLVK